MSAHAFYNAIRQKARAIGRFWRLKWTESDNWKLEIRNSKYLTSIRHFLASFQFLVSNYQFIKRKHFFIPVVIVGLLVVFFTVSSTNAQTLDTTGVTNSILAGVSKMLLALAKVCMGLTIFGLKFFIELAAYNGYIEAPPVIIGWIMVRDVANMFFVVVLLAIAFGTILGLEQYEWKKTLVKLIFAAVFINFSKLIAQVIIDVGHVFTMTFLNAITATAGGNLINLFNFQGMLKILGQDPSLNSTTDIRVDIFAASVLALVFASLAMMTVGAYLIVMAMRVVVLWVLIILAPLAYILGVIPNTKSYADEYWSTFTKHVLVAPIMVFFLWLAFATLGNGNIASQINLQMGPGTLANTAAGIQGPNSFAAANPSASILEVTTWENMANFIIAIAFLLVGISAVQRLGVQGGGLVSSAVSFAKNVATIASGYAAGRFLVGAAKKGAVGGGKLAALGLYKLPGLDIEGRVQRTKKWAQIHGLSFLGRTKYQMPFVIKKGKKGQKVKMWDEEKNDWKEKELEEDQEYMGMREMKNLSGLGWLQKSMQKSAIKNIARDKQLEKTENFLKEKKEILDSLTQGIPKGIFMSKDENEDAIDRRYQGIKDQLKARSAAKTEEYKTQGAKLIGSIPRIQFKTKKGIETTPFLHKDRGTQAMEEARHLIMAEKNKKELDRMKGQAKLDITLKVDKETGKNLLGDLYKTIAAERAAHLKQLQFERQMKEQARVFAGSDAGIHETTEENVAEKAIKAAEDYVARVKDEDLRDAFATARNKLEEIIQDNKEDPELIAAAIKKLIADGTDESAYISALYDAQELAVTSREKNVSEKQAVDNMNDAIIALPQGSRSPSTALSDELKIEEGEYSGMERLQAQKKAADNIATLMAKKGKDGELKMRDQLALFAAVKAVNMEAWNDDVFDHVFAQIKELKAGNLSGQEKIKAENMAKLADAMGWDSASVDPATGKPDYKKIKATYGRKMSAQLQNISGMGSYVAAKAHNEVEDHMENEQKTTKNNLDTTRQARRSAAISDAQSGAQLQDVLGKAFSPAELQQMQNQAQTAGASLSSVIFSDPQSAKRFRDALAAQADLMVEAQDRAAMETVSDYERALKIVAPKLQSKLGISAQQYLDIINKAQDFMQTAAREFTKEAYATKHYESAHNQQYDTKMKMIRPQTVREAQAETAADMDKMLPGELARAQIHSFGEMDMNSHLMKSISERMYRSILGQIEEEYQMNSVNLRTAKKLYGMTADEDAQKEVKKDGTVLAIFGGKQMNQTVGAGAVGSTERGAHLISDYIVPQLLGGHKAFLYGMKRLFGNLDLQEANQGKLNIKVDGFGEIGNIRQLVTTIGNNKDLIKRIGNGDETEGRKNLERLEALAKQAETARAGGKGLGLVEKQKQQARGQGRTTPGQAASGGP